jgi:serine/threonine protein kinase
MLDVSQETLTQYQAGKISRLALLKQSKIKLIDLGISKNLTQTCGLTASNAGSNETKAPEIGSRQNYGLPADIYSFGLMICCMLTGRYITDEEELFRALNEKHISEQLIKLVLRMCRINPDERPNAK